MFRCQFFRSPLLPVSIRRPLALVCALWIGVYLSVGCSADDPDSVASFNGWSLSAEDLERDYERVNGEETFAEATRSQKAQFAEILMDEELLLKLAREACPEPDYKRVRLDRVLYEKSLMREFLASRRQQYALSPETEAAAIELISREAIVNQFTLRSEDLDKIRAEGVKGTPFEELAEKYAAVTRFGGPAFERTTVRFGEAPREIIAAVFLRDLPVGTTVGPIRTNQGIYMVKIIDLAPFDIQATHPEAMDMAKRVIRDLYYMPFNKAYTESLFAEGALKIYHEQEPLIQERFEAYWDSIDAVRHLGQSVDYQTLRSPKWLFSAEEEALPMYDLYGKQYNIGEFVESLDYIDLDAWPTKGQLKKIAYQIEQRATRMLYQIEAEKVGFASGEFSARNERIKERHLLSQFRDRYLLSTHELNDDELRLEYTRNPELYQSPDEVAYGLLIFPLDQEEQAQAAWEHLSGGDPLAWYELGPAEEAKGTGVIYHPDTGLLGIREAPPDPSWAPFRDTATGLETGEIAPPMKTQHGFTIIRCHERVRPQRLSFAEAEEPIRRNAIQHAVDKEIDERIRAARAKYEATVHRDRIGPENASAGATTTTDEAG